MAHDGEDVLDPLVYPLAYHWLKCLIVESHGRFIGFKNEPPMSSIFACFRIVIPDDIGGSLVYEGKRSDNYMRRDTRVEKGEYEWNNSIISPRSNNLPQADMEIIIVSLRLLLVPSCPLCSCKRFDGFFPGLLRYLFLGSFGPAFVAIQIIESVESHTELES